MINDEFNHLMIIYDFTNFVIYDSLNGNKLFLEQKITLKGFMIKDIIYDN